MAVARPVVFFVFLAVAPILPAPALADSLDSTVETSVVQTSMAPEIPKAGPNVGSRAVIDSLPPAHLTVAGPDQSDSQPAPNQPGQPAQLDDTAGSALVVQPHRILGILPAYTSTDASADIPLTPEQKFGLAFRFSTDPFIFGAAGLFAGVGQLRDSPAAYGQGFLGFSRRMGAYYADSFSGTMIGNGLLPAALHQDPRYFRKGKGSFGGRLLYALSSQFRCQHDGGGWEPSYGNLLGNLAAAGISNIYYPENDRGMAPTLARAASVTVQGMLGSSMLEFWPDVYRHCKRKSAKP